MTKPSHKPYTTLAIKTGQNEGLDAYEVRRAGYQHKDRDKRDFIWSLGSINIYATSLESTNGFPLEWYYAWDLQHQRIAFFLNSETEAAIRNIAKRKLKGAARA